MKVGEIFPLCLATGFCPDESWVVVLSPKSRDGPVRFAKVENLCVSTLHSITTGLHTVWKLTINVSLSKLITSFIFGAKIVTLFFLKYNNLHIKMNNLLSKASFAEKCDILGHFQPLWSSFFLRLCDICTRFSHRQIYGLWHMCESEGVIDISHSFRPFKTQLYSIAGCS